MVIKKDKLDKKLNSVHVLTNCLGQLNIGKDIGGIDGDVIIIIVVLSIIHRHPGTWVQIGQSDRSDHGPTVRPRSDPSDPPLDRTV